MTSSITEGGQHPIGSCSSMIIVLAQTAWCFYSLYAPDDLDSRIPLWEWMSLSLSMAEQIIGKIFYGIDG